MSELEDKLNSVLNNPQLMQQIMSMAQNMNDGSSKNSASTPKPESFPEFDLNMLQKLSGFAQKSSIDPNQKSLLSALTPYLSRERIVKLEKAMRAARMAQLASGLLSVSQISSSR